MRMTGLAAALDRDLAAKGLNAAVKPPKRIADQYPSGGVGVSTWRIDIETQLGRQNMPKQKIRLDVDNATSRTRELREVARNYDVLHDLGTLVHVQSREEILAGKLVAFSSSVVNRNRPRHRDIWDIRWLAGNGVKLHADLVCAKAQDQRIPQAWMEIASDGRSPLSGRRNSPPRCGGSFRRRLQDARSTIHSLWSSSPAKPNASFSLRPSVGRKSSRRIRQAESGKGRPSLAIMIRLHLRTRSARRRPHG